MLLPHGLDRRRPAPVSAGQLAVYLPYRQHGGGLGRALSRMMPTGTWCCCHNIWCATVWKGCSGYVSRHRYAFLCALFFVLTFYGDVERAVAKRASVSLALVISAHRRSQQFSESCDAPHHHAIGMLGSSSGGGVMSLRCEQQSSGDCRSSQQ